MPGTETVDVPPAARPPRAMAWVLLLASAAAVLLVGAAATALIFSPFVSGLPQVPAAYWLALLAGCALTLASLGLRGLRWVFLLRRSSTRIPIRDAYIGYFSGLSLLFAPLLIGEIAVRAFVLRTRGHVPVSTVIALNMWERLLDLAALSIIAAVAGMALGRIDFVTGAAAGVAVGLSIPMIRRQALAVVATIARAVGQRFDRAATVSDLQLAGEQIWWAALTTSIAAWLLPALGLFALVRVWGYSYGAVLAEYDYAAASSVAGLALAPGGILVAGGRLLTALQSQQVPSAVAALSILGVRLATVGVSTALGGVVLALHWRTAAADSAAHFDDIADAYDVQIPESRRLALLARKTEMMRDALRGLRAGARGLDVGCGQGAYVARMRDLGFEMSGIDASPAQVAIAARRLSAAGVVSVGSALDIPATDASYDFVYTINVLHHLVSIDEQRRAFAEIFRVLRPGGVLFVHEINTRNIAFRFYMGYVFPSLNCIDEGIERWLLPNNLSAYTNVPAADIRYFTFFPDFLPEPIVERLSACERWLERSAFRVYSAHYMAVWRKP